MRGLIRQSLRIFQLPIQVRSEFAACKALAHFLRRGAIRYEDSLTWTRLELNLWRESGRPSKGLRRAVQAVLSVEVSNTTAFSSAKYFSLHERLRSDHGFGHEESTAFLSHLNLAIGLVQAQRFTGARLTQVLSSIDTRVRFTRQSISQAISALGLRTEINIDQLDSVWKRDKSFEEVFFADADLSDSAEIAGEAASDLGFRGNLKTGLLFLAPVQELAKYVPYIQMLHFQCVIPEYFDHSVLDLYEFSPRG